MKKMTKSHHKRDPPRQSRQQRRRHPRGYIEAPPTADGEATGPMEDEAALGEEMDSHPVYLQSGADSRTETLTYRNNFQHIGPGLSTTNFDTSTWTSTAGYPISSLSGGSDTGANAYGPNIFDYDPNTPDLFLSYPVAGIGTGWTDSNPTTDGDHATTILVPNTTTPYGISSYGISITPSPPTIGGLDETSHTSNNTFRQDQHPQTHVHEDSYDFSSGRRWSTENYQGSTAGSSPEQIITGVMETQFEEEHTSERPREHNIGMWVQSSEDPWSPETAHDNVHNTSYSNFDGGTASNGADNNK
ncbi:hypothetical protein F5B19DRAFT_276026 [Rostrohypoxylon terebratum]|nr:hypothetical protein F5B19DRAFT_276026 [Rostrohypoxylon terebratum]